MKILSDRMLGIKGSAEHSRWTYVDRLSCSVDKKLRNNAPHFRIRRGTFPYGYGVVEDDASTISHTPTTLYTNTRVKLTIATDLSFSERIAIANLSYK